MKFKNIIGNNSQQKRLESMFANSMIPQTMLFYGMPGIGKKKVAFQFLAAIYCEDPKNSPCLTCHACRQIENKSFSDLVYIGPDEKNFIPLGNAEKKEPGSIRWLIDRLSRKSFSGNYGVVIDGADCISVEGQNALLKTIEEPPAGAHVILLSSNKSQILQTILSRCSEVSFNPLNNEEVSTVLEMAGVENRDMLSGISGGSVELALLLADQNVYAGVIALCEEISCFLKEKSRLNLDINQLQKITGIDNLFMILVNIYRGILVDIISGKSSHDYYPDSIIVQDTATLRKIIKILLAQRRGLSRNLNIKSSLKSMLYEIDTMKDVGSPDIYNL